MDAWCMELVHLILGHQSVFKLAGAKINGRVS